MNRSLLPGTIDQFFGHSKEKRPISVEEVKHPSLFLRFTKDPLNSKCTIVSIPALDHPKPVPDSISNSVLDKIANGVKMLFSYSSDTLSYSQLSRLVEQYSAMKGAQTLMPLILAEVTNFVSNFGANFKPTASYLSIFDSTLSDFQKIFASLQSLPSMRRQTFSGLAYSILSSSISVPTEKANGIPTFVRSQILRMIAQFRLSKSQQFNGGEFSTFLRFSQKVDIYTKFVEPEILSKSREFFEEQSSFSDVREFISSFHSAILRERSLSEFGLPMPTVQSIEAIANTAYLSKSVIDSLKPSLYTTISNKEFDTIGSLARLFSDSAYFRCSVADYFEQRLRSIFNVPHSEWIKSVLDELISFPSLFQYEEVHSAMVQAIQKNSDEMAKMLALHITRVPEIPDPLFDIFKCVRSKEVFESSYSYLLCRKVAEFVPIDIERENTIISKIREMTGEDFVQSFRAIITDYSDSQAVHVAPKSFEFKAISIFRDIWAKSAGSSAILPSEIELAQSEFALEYQSKFKGRKIMFCPELSSCAIRISEFEARMNGCQLAVVASVASGHPKLNEIQERSGLNPECLNDCIKALLRVSVIVSRENEFYLAQLHKCVEVPSVTSLSSEKEKEDQDSIIARKRENQVQCAIMQRLKTAKAMRLTELYSETLNQLSFVPNQTRFIAILNNLIAKDFIEKSGEQIYRYKD